MSHIASYWAIQQTGVSSSAKLLLLVLADYHNSVDGGCFPSKSSLAEKCCCTERNIVNLTQELADVGLITIERRFDSSKRQTSNQYVLNISPTGVKQDSPLEQVIYNQDTIPTELEDDPVMSIFANAEEPPEDNPKAFWDQAVGMLQALHVSPKTINPFIGRCLKMVDQDQERVLDAIQAAVDAEPHDAVPYIVAVLGGKKERKTARFEKTAKQKEIEDAFAKLEAASERRKAQWAADLGEDYTGTGGGEDLPIIQHQPPSEPVSISGKRSEGVRELPRRSPAQVSRPRKGYLNESEVSAHDF
jgi:hypothetical protein